jgi:uncharacterized cupredoxin-like copper-binding protein
MPAKVLLAAAMAWCAALLVTACSGGDSAPATPKLKAVEVRLGEYTLVPSIADASSGSVAFEAKNGGLREHELVVVRTDLAPDALTVVGSQVDEQASGLAVAHISTTDLQPGKSAIVSVNLAAGQYVLICNVATHYQLGMRAGFTVR